MRHLTDATTPGHGELETTENKGWFSLYPGLACNHMTESCYAEVSPIQGYRVTQSRSLQNKMCDITIKGGSMM